MVETQGELGGKCGTWMLLQGAMSSPWGWRWKCSKLGKQGIEQFGDIKRHIGMRCKVKTGRCVEWRGQTWQTRGLDEMSQWSSHQV